MLSLSIIIPLYNEEKRLKKTLPELSKFLKKSLKDNIKEAINYCLNENSRHIYESMYHYNKKYSVDFDSFRSYVNHIIIPSFIYPILRDKYNGDYKEEK